jgi:hypothetical protein
LEVKELDTSLTALIVLLIPVAINEVLFKAGSVVKASHNNDKESNTQSVEPSKEEPTFKQLKGGGLIAKGCGKIMGDRRKVTKMY